MDAVPNAVGATDEWCCIVTLTYPYIVITNCVFVGM